MIQMIRHRPGAWGMQLGLGPGLRSRRALSQLQDLFADNAPWAAGRSLLGLRRMLWGSEAVVSAWQGERLVGFGRATSDGQFRAVLWDVVVARDVQRQGLGRSLVEALVTMPVVSKAELIYLMTTNGEGFYRRIGFTNVKSQQLMKLENKSTIKSG
jgi:ribosomal protein S18 acetylase RimI-like enzyme